MLLCMADLSHLHISSSGIHNLHAVFVFANHAVLFQQDLQHQNMAVHLIKVLIELNDCGNEQTGIIKSKESEQAN